MALWSFTPLLLVTATAPRHFPRLLLQQHQNHLTCPLPNKRKQDNSSLNSIHCARQGSIGYLPVKIESYFSLESLDYTVYNVNCSTEMFGNWVFGTLKNILFY